MASQALQLTSSQMQWSSQQKPATAHLRVLGDHLQVGICTTIAASGALLRVWRDVLVTTPADAQIKATDRYRTGALRCARAVRTVKRDATRRATNVRAHLHSDANRRLTPP
jgi:hypothetical protein